MMEKMYYLAVARKNKTRNSFFWKDESKNFIVFKKKTCYAMPIKKGNKEVFP